MKKRILTVLAVLAVAAIAAGFFAAKAAASGNAHARMIERNHSVQSIRILQITKKGKEVTERVIRRNPSCGSTVSIWLTNRQDGGSFVTGNGAGNAMTIQSPQLAPQYSVTCPSSGGRVFHPTNNPGNCIIEADNSHDSTVITSSDCSVDRRRWSLTNNEFGGFLNESDLAAVYTKSGQDGSTVFFKTGDLPQGAWANFTAG